MKLINLPGNTTYYIDQHDATIWSLATQKTRKSADFRVYEDKTLFRLQPWVDKDGYYRVTLECQQIGKNQGLHRLLALTFIPNPENKPLVRHLDDNKLNNSLDNLAWGTIYDNTKDAIRNGKTQYVDKTPIIELLEQGLRGQEICKAIGASAATVSRTTKKWLASQEN